MSIPTDELAHPLVVAVHRAHGRRPHLSTVLRWCQRRNKYGNKLESWLQGGRRVTSVEAVRRYDEANTTASESRDDGTPKSTPAQQTKAHAEAVLELDREFAS